MYKLFTNIEGYPEVINYLKKNVVLPIILLFSSILYHTCIGQNRWIPNKDIKLFILVIYLHFSCWLACDFRRWRWHKLYAEKNRWGPSKNKPKYRQNRIVDQGWSRCDNLDLYKYLRVTFDKKRTSSI